MTGIRRNVAFIAVSAFAVMGSLGVIQGAPNDAETRTAANQGKSAGTDLDRHAAACLILENQNEVALAKLAQERSQSSEVKKFAEMMQTDHEKFIGELEKFAAHDFRSRLGTLEKDGDRKETRTERAAGDRTTAARENSGNAGMLTADKMLQIKQEIADQCLASARAELDGKQDREFDQCYIGMQIGAHMHMIDALKVLERHVSPDLRSVVANGLTTAENHLTRAKRIMKDIDQVNTAGNPKTSTAK